MQVLRPLGRRLPSLCLAVLMPAASIRGDR